MSYKSTNSEKNQRLCQILTDTVFSRLNFNVRIVRKLNGIKGDLFVEVLAVSQKRTEEVLIQLPERIVSEKIEQAYNQITKNTNECVYIPTKRSIQTKQKNHMREAMVKGYVEMSQINLSICSECLHVEYEAEHMVERLVSGG